MLHYGPNQQPTWRAKGRVTIINSPELEQTWKRTDNNVKYGWICASTARYLEIKLEFRFLVKLKTKTYFHHKKSP